MSHDQLTVSAECVGGGGNGGAVLMMREAERVYFTRTELVRTTVLSTGVDDGVGIFRQRRSTHTQKTHIQMMKK